VKPAPFDYHRPSSLDEALALLEDDDAKPLAGGQSLVPMLNFRLLRPSVLVDINRIPGLAYIDEGADAIRVGMSLAELERHFILATLEQYGGEKRKAAEVLGISLKTMYNRLNNYAAAV